MGKKKLPRFEEGKPLSASALNQVAAAAEKALCLVGTIAKDDLGHEWARRGDGARPYICLNCGSLSGTEGALKECVPCPCLEPVEYWKDEAKKAFAERDEAKRLLKEAKPTIAVDEWRKQFQYETSWESLCVTLEPKFEGWGALRLVPDRLLAVVEAIEKEDKIVARMDAPAEFIRTLRAAGKDVFVPVGAWSGEGKVGILQLGVNVDVHLNNALPSGTMRLFLEHCEYKEFQFPAAPPTVHGFPIPKEPPKERPANR